MNKPTFSILILLGVAIIGVSWIRALPISQADRNNPKLKIAFLDVGQGDAILLTTPHRKHILIDGGPDGTVLTRLGEEMPFYEHTIDLMVATHNHADHITGLNRVMERFDVERMWISGAIHTTNEYLHMLENIKTNGIPTEVVWKGKSTEIDGVTFDVLHPIETSEGQRPEDQHDATIVIRVTYGQTHFLLTGDIDEHHEQAIIQSGALLQSDVLKVPHHGSASGLALNFLNLVNPHYAIIEVGKDNKYGHPTDSILHKLIDRDIKLFRTDQDGTVIAISNGSMITVNKKKK